MSLIECPDCKKQISNKAVSCPYCGCPAEFFCYSSDETTDHKENNLPDVSTIPQSLLKKHFGYDFFKECQEEIIESIISGNDVLAVMPTGAGKSICYQIPSLIFDGVTIVISPLISLMQDQVRSLNDSGIRSAYINSSLSDRQISVALNRASLGEYKLIYVAPERLESNAFMNFANNTDIFMVAVDEAHCISQWGQDFRPSYLKIADFIKSLKRRPIIGAFTATATPEVKDDICCILGLKDPDIYVTGFDRPNLYFEVDQIKDKTGFVKDYIKAHPEESGIIYCATRKTTDELYDSLILDGVKASKYHAGMNSEERKTNQNCFINDELPIIVATNAFGMGIDKSNVRFVIHYNMPQSMENYYQEAGRAGRDGEPASCILLFSPQDVRINRFLLEKKDFTDVPEENVSSIRDRDMLRLHNMEGYCKTTGCLRNYILSYFEDSKIRKCNNCGNCLKKYVEAEVTTEAKKVLNCVFETHSRYGATTIAGILSGANKARLREIGATSLKTYGALSESSEKRIRAIISSMLDDEYLIITDNEFNIIGISRKSADFKKPDFKYTIKEIQETKEKHSTKRTQNSYLTSLGFELFAKLRALRFEIAQKNGIPPYVVFSDKTLTDMCVKLPSNEQEMLDVSGVASVKYQKYGDDFLQAIIQFVSDHSGRVISEFDKSSVDNQPPEKQKKKSKRKQPFYLNTDDIVKVKYSEYAFISEIRDRLNNASSVVDSLKLSYNELNRFLIEKEYIKIVNIDGQQKKVPTDKGFAAGVIEVDRYSEKTDQTYKLIQYPEHIQKEIVNYFCRKDL